MKSDTEAVARRSAPRRRRYGKEFKREVVKATLVPGASVAAIALQHRLNANVLFKWRRKYLRELAPLKAKSANLLPVTIEDAKAVSTPQRREAIAGSEPRRYSTLRSYIEIELYGARIRLKGVVDAALLRTVLKALSER